MVTRTLDIHHINTGREQLRAHSHEFREEVIKVVDGVHVAVGYSLGNAILIQGDGGSIIVDTLSNVADAREVRAEFDKISRAPVRAIVYTHFHPDHVGGAAAFSGKRPARHLQPPIAGRASARHWAGQQGRRQPVRLRPWRAASFNGPLSWQISFPPWMRRAPLPGASKRRP
ncbi:MAG: MBL fold metallo-hydrolase [Acidimicrobiia bacterium]|nr:MBL fold metallo-hydrolase [Acidimicrobiia bacterium]